MAVKIGRSLEEIDNKVKALNQTLRTSQDEIKALDSALKLNPKDTEKAAQKVKVLGDTVGTATQKVALLKQKQAEANAMMQKGDMSAAEYKKIEIAVLKAENEVTKLNKELKETRKVELNNVGKNFDQLTGKLQKAQSVAQSFSRVAMGIVASLGAAMTAFVVVGKELDSTSKKFKMSAEELQLQRGIYQNVTGSADNYDAALSKLNTALTNIAKGKGAAYVDTLNQIGISTVDADGKTKSLTQVYGEIMTALGNVADETERATLANILFGENGYNVANVAALTNEEIRALNEQTIQNGIVTSEAAAQAGEVGRSIDDMKQQMQAATAEMLVALLPTVKTLIDFAKTTIIPIINTIAGWFKNMSPQQQQFIFFLLMLVILLPKMISIVTAIIGVVKLFTVASYASAGGVGAVSAAATPLLPIIWAVAAAILVLVLLFVMLSGKSKDVTKELKGQQSEMSKMQSQYGDVGTDMEYTSTSISQNSNTTTTEINVNITAEGETFLSQESADKVADALADRINRELGGKI